MRASLGLGLGRIGKRLVPRSLLGRSLLIILLPLVILQAVALQIFYGSHLDIVSRRLSGAVAGEIASVLDLMRRYPGPRQRDWIMQTWRMTNTSSTCASSRGRRLLPVKHEVQCWGRWTTISAAALAQKLTRPFTMDWTSDPQSVLIRVQLDDGVLDGGGAAQAAFDVGTIYIFVVWVGGSALLLFGIAALFMRNQVRAIRRLAAAAEAFGMGRDAGPIKPEGAVRGAPGGGRVQPDAGAHPPLPRPAHRDAGRRVSHDLRTPLTRLRLAIAMLPPAEAIAPDVAEMTADVEEMDRMIGGYLAFARGEGTEQAQPVDLAALLEEVATGARRAGAEVACEAPRGPDAAAAARRGAPRDHQSGGQCAPARAADRALGAAAGARRCR